MLKLASATTLTDTIENETGPLDMETSFSPYQGKGLLVNAYKSFPYKLANDGYMDTGINCVEYNLANDFSHLPC